MWPSSTFDKSLFEFDLVAALVAEQQLEQFEKFNNQPSHSLKEVRAQRPTCQKCWPSSVLASGVSRGCPTPTCREYLATRFLASGPRGQANRARQRAWQVGMVFQEHDYWQVGISILLQQRFPGSVRKHMKKSTLFIHNSRKCVKTYSFRKVRIRG
jgi:hypothetical protein